MKIMVPVADVKDGSRADLSIETHDAKCYLMKLISGKEGLQFLITKEDWEKLKRIKEGG